MKKKIYYLENEQQHFEAVKLFLTKHDYEVAPETGAWSAELLDFQNFLINQADQDRIKALNNIFEKAKPDLIIIDLDLGPKYDGDGGDIYENFMLRSREYSSIPVIYLTISGKDAKRVNKRTRHVVKVVHFSALDVNAIGKELLMDIKDLLNPPSNKGFIDRLIDSI